MDSAYALLGGLVIIGVLAWVARWLLARPTPGPEAEAQVGPVPGRSGVSPSGRHVVINVNDVLNAPPSPPLPLREEEINRQAPPLFEAEPRRRALQAAIKNFWKIDVVYIKPDSQRFEGTLRPMRVDDAVVICQPTMWLRVDRIEKLSVQAVREDTRRRYQIG